MRWDKAAAKTHSIVRKHDQKKRASVQPVAGKNREATIERTSDGGIIGPASQDILGRAPRNPNLRVVLDLTGILHSASREGGGDLHQTPQGRTARFTEAVKTCLREPQCGIHE